MTKLFPLTLQTPCRLPARAAAAVIAVLVLVMAGPVAAAQTDRDPDADAGAEVYRNSCAMCHGGDATGMMGMHPALRGAVDRLGPDGVEVTIRDGRATNPPMPAFEDRLGEGEIADVVAYIGSLPDGPRNFGPGHEDGMGGGMMDGMMDGGGSAWMVVLVVIVAAALAGVVGYLVGTHRSRRP